MKSTILSLMILMALTACNKSSSKKSSSSNPSTQPTTPTDEICVQYPTAYGCSGNTAGGTTSGDTGGGGNVNDPYEDYAILPPPSDNNWQEKYPGGVPAPSNPCSTPTGSGYDLRRGTITMAGGMMYKPDHPWTTFNAASPYASSSYTHVISSFLVDPAKVKQFLDTDAKLRVRFKVRPQPNPPKGKDWCMGRTTASGSDTYGYRTLEFKVGVRGFNADGTLKPEIESIKSATAQVNGCSQVLDFSGVNQNHPHGIALVVMDVYSDQGCWYSGGCTAMTQVKTRSCWSMDIEASVDGTKNI